ncbi:cobalt-precorrin-5B (C(1))-methyltransferase CbiD [Prochlorococcus marinus]|uniref:cobalt-precorrin-5B (C(1))-methyltransferase CbiD n=1 Tax=Prochlorococcus marinus TaxID=1219 RepID=UPI001AD9A9E6|nr:cobalt-precorrin-5B (C(1))-methyltransferase CbiD [Prochlorococcus marinus]MBO8220091.1 cobalt-precorrin-5B (C(1))-methyltransferase [Prochlorococcus marinus CUG1417]MBW3074728.1 cobalt-precorrin-5B (C(1))-methyltransferase [Prochlorococcus marinus str. MU1417]
MKKGFSLPLWVAGAARSALKKLVGLPFENYELIKIPNEKKEIKIEIHSVGLLKDDSHALGISFAKSGLELDITQNLEIWTIASLEKISSNNPVKTNHINIIAGSGVGIKEKTSEICISNFAKEVLYENLLDIIPEGFNLNLEIIFPNGEFLAERTSNKSFGIVGGLSIIGTSAETYSSASPQQLEEAKFNLAKLIQDDFKGKVVFVIGENGLNLANNYNVNLPIIKIGNWIGPLLVDAAIKKVKTVILFGYHGKLIKLAGGIFHTHNHLADGRIEILVYLAVREKLPLEIIVKLSHLNTLEDALLLIERFNKSLADRLFQNLSNTIEKRSFAYVNRYLKTDMEIASIIFDRKRKIRWSGNHGKNYISYFQ